jgi:putative hemolysin
MKTKTFLIILCLLLAGCSLVTGQAADVLPADPPIADATMSSLPNPASVYCEQQGGKSEIRTATDGSQTGYCFFADGNECDEWAYYRGICDPNTAVVPSGSSSGSASVPVSPTPIPSVVPIEESFYQGFWTYTHPDYGFSIMLPEDWVVDETTTFDPLMNDHGLILHPKDAQDVSPSLRMAFRNIGDDSLIWPTGVGQGEFIPGGTMEVAGAPVQRIYLVCPQGQIQSIWYHGGDNEPNIQRGNMEFSFIYSYTGSYCEGDLSLGGKVQLVGELIIASLQVP